MPTYTFKGPHGEKIEADFSSPIEYMNVYESVLAAYKKTGSIGALRKRKDPNLQQSLDTLVEKKLVIDNKLLERGIDQFTFILTGPDYYITDHPKPEKKKKD